MFFTAGILLLIFATVTAVFIVYTMWHTLRKEKELISKKHLIYFVPSVILVYALLLITGIYRGDEIDFYYCFNLVSSAFDVFIFKISSFIPAMRQIAAEYPIFYADYILTFTISIATVILSIASFFSARIYNFLRKIRFCFRDCDILIGDSESALKYLKANKNCMMWGVGVSRKRYAELLKEGYCVWRSGFNSKLFGVFARLRERHFIVFRDSGQPFFKIIEYFSKLKRRNKKFLFLHFEVNQEETKFFKDEFIAKADENSRAFISCFGKYELIARQFVWEYPLTKFIPRDFYRPNCTVCDGKEINVVFVGFGKVNRQMFRMCAMQFQFAAEQNGELVSKPIHYYVFDKEETSLHNDTLTRFQYEIKEAFRESDFPVPEPICDLDDSKPLDAHSVAAKQKMRSLVHKNSYTFFIVSLDDDIADASYARTLEHLLVNESNYKIFVRAKNKNGENLSCRESSVLYFGSDESFYTHDCIVNDELTGFAQRINLLYKHVNETSLGLSAAQDEKISGEEKRELVDKCLSSHQNRAYMIEAWSKLETIKQYSNLYHAFNLPFKIHMLGFSMRKRKNPEDVGISEATFNEKYVNSGKADQYCDYSFFFKTESSNVLAFIEHSRWNALYILYDYVQMKKSEMKISVKIDQESRKTVREVVHQDNERKRHACVTTYRGLDSLIRFKFKLLYPEKDFDKAVSEKDESILKLKDLYAYDYMDLDRLYEEFHVLGYVIDESKKRR
jgi:hypothetical protein